jgi:hypothetical protein
MVLYNGNAEVIGNFRALNFYKASDVRIKEDIRKLIDGEFVSLTRVTNLVVYTLATDLHTLLRLRLSRCYDANRRCGV